MIRKGSRVFFADNSKDYPKRCDLFARIARASGLTPVVFGGAKLAIQHSNQDREIRDDFYGAQAIVLYFGTPNDASNHEDHWVLPELRHRIEAGVHFILYVADEFPVSVLQRHGYTGRPHVLSAREDFGTALQSDLNKLLGGHL